LKLSGRFIHSYRNAFRDFFVWFAALAVFAFVLFSLFCARAFSDDLSEGQSKNALRLNVLSVEPRAFDFGEVEAGTMLSHRFAVKNLTTETLHLRASASCGCTTPKLEKSELQPDEFTNLDVEIDTSMKQDSVTKTVTIHTDDSHESRTDVKLSMLVTDPHAGMASEGGSKIFTDQKCAACHVTRGEGKFGRDLYNADCAMCHGPKAEGAVGPPLFGPYQKKEYAQIMQNIVEKGSATHRSMPGFLDTSGGPLTQEQVQSVLDYLAALSNSRGVVAPNTVQKKK
jgi:mono/diheme cytochrome c family protein